MLGNVSLDINCCLKTHSFLRTPLSENCLFLGPQPHSQRPLLGTRLLGTDNVRGKILILSHQMDAIVRIIVLQATGLTGFR